MTSRLHLEHLVVGPITGRNRETNVPTELCSAFYLLPEEG